MSRSNPLHRLAHFGQSVWLDYIERGFISSGDLASVIADDGVVGLTSNPAIFHKAIAAGGEYEPAIARWARDGLAAHEIYEALVIEDIRNAADALARVHEETRGRDGYVSLEVSPRLAHDAEGTFWEAKRLAALVNRPNLMIKVPGTQAGVDAARRLLVEGLNINVTLLFDPQRYAAVAEAHLQALEERLATGQPIHSVASVASFFVSRIDTLVDASLEAHPQAAARTLRGQAAVALAKLAYRHYRELLASPRWQALARRGAQPQRVLWASTGTKNPAYSDVKYVEALIGPDTVTTLPVETLIAYRDHGDPALRLESAAPDDGSRAPERIIQELAAAGLEITTICAQLETTGVRKFIEPLDATLAELRKRIARIRPL